MKTIQSSQAKTHLLSLLDDVERGEVIQITRHGKPIARIVPEADEAAQRRKTFEEFRAWRKEAGIRGLSVEDILSARDEGRK